MSILGMVLRLLRVWREYGYLAGRWMGEQIAHLGWYGCSVWMIASVDGMRLVHTNG